MAPTAAADCACWSGSASSWPTRSDTPTRPPGRSTRAISANTAGLSAERLITQLEMTTSTEASGSGMASM
jgi:hypothetical protein